MVRLLLQNVIQDLCRLLLAGVSFVGGGRGSNQVLIAETGRIPVDNPATHLELTMIHEAMILEYSGPYLALIEWSAAMKQLVLMTLLVNVFFPFGLSSGWSHASTLLSLVLFSAKLLLLAAAVVLVETTNAKLRLFRVPELLAVAFVLSAMALISTFLF